MRPILLVAVVTALLAGCGGSPQSREALAKMSGAELLDETSWYRVDDMYAGWGSWDRESYKVYMRQLIVDAHPEWRPQYRESVLGALIQVGMSKDQVQASWGPPRDLHRERNPIAVTEWWYYGYRHYGLYSQRLKFVDGVLDWWTIDEGKYYP